MKRCTICKAEKGLDQYPKDRTRGDGIAPACFQCRAKLNASYYSRNRERILARCREQRAGV